MIAFEEFITLMMVSNIRAKVRKLVQEGIGTVLYASNSLSNARCLGTTSVT